MTTPFFGYPGQIWSAAYQALSYLNQQLENVTNVASTESLAAATLQTLLNGLAAINGYRISQAWSSSSIGIGTVEALPIVITSAETEALTARGIAYANAAPALAALLPQAPFAQASVALPAGQPMIPDPGLFSFYTGFDFEIAPSGLTMDNFMATVDGVPGTFQAIAQAIQVFYGNYVTSAYDVADRLSRAAQPPADILSNLQSGALATPADINLLWNQMATLPAMLIDASILSTPPFSLAVQQMDVIRYAMLTASQQLALFLLILRAPVTTQILLADVYNNDTLMDVANRALGDYEQWSNIASLNNLQPPYTGRQAAPGVAQWGKQVLLPTSGTSGSAAGQAPSYLANFLGIDLYFGPINGVMPPWGGDYQTIMGYPNLAISLGRRMQTTLGTLLYHNDYGSLIPPEVGMIQTSDTAGQIAAFATSAIKNDPRVQAVLAASAELLDNGAVQFNGSVQPAGPGVAPVLLNEVIAPLNR